MSDYPPDMTTPMLNVIYSDLSVTANYRITARRTLATASCAPPCGGADSAGW